MDCINEERLHAHLLFTHNKYMQPCGTSVAFNQNELGYEIRREFKILKKKLTWKKNYLIHYVESIIENKRIVEIINYNIHDAEKNYKSWIIDLNFIKEKSDYMNYVTDHIGDKLVFIQRNLDSIATISKRLDRLKLDAKENHILLEI